MSILDLTFVPSRERGGLFGEQRQTGKSRSDKVELSAVLPLVDLTGDSQILRDYSWQL